MSSFNTNRFNLKRSLKKAILRSSLFRAAGRVAPTRAAILMYHSIVEDPSQTEHILGVSRDRVSFAAHMETLARDFNPVSLDDVARFAGSRSPLPPRSVAVTFDDGFADNYEVALPILNRYGIPATFYIYGNAVNNGSLPWYCRIRYAFHKTNKIEWNDEEKRSTLTLTSEQQRGHAMRSAWGTGAKLTGTRQSEFVHRLERSLEVEPNNAPHGFMLQWEQVRSLRKAGHTIGAHTLSHPNVAQISLADARSEIVGSREMVERELGETVEHFSYPHPALNPQWSPQTLEITRDAGFKSATLTARGPIRAGDDPLTLKRIYTPADLDQFKWNLESTFLGWTV